MANAFQTGVLTATSDGSNIGPRLTTTQRDYLSDILLETIRTENMFVQFCQPVTDFNAHSTGFIQHTEMYDLEPQWNPIGEDDLWLNGAYLDTRSLRIELAIYAGKIAWTDYHQMVNYLNAGMGGLTALCREKLGRSMTDTLDILARNAFLDMAHVSYAGGATGLDGVAADGYFNPNWFEDIYTNLQERDIPGVFSARDGGGRDVVALTTPRVVRDIRMNAADISDSSEWLDVIKYANPELKMKHEAGAWAATRVMNNNRLKLTNCGLVTKQTTLAAAPTKGDGATSTVDNVWTPGQTGSTRYIELTDSTGFAVGDVITIHSKNATATLNFESTTDSNGKYMVLPSDGTQETRQIKAIDGNNVSLDKPILKDHLILDYVTVARDIHATIIMGGPGVVFGIGQKPQVFFPPKIDDAQMVNRVTWRMFGKFQPFRPEWIEVVFSAGTAKNASF